MSRVYRYHYLRIMEGVERMKRNEYPRPAYPVQTLLNVRKRFNVLKQLWREVDKVEGIVLNKEYVIRTIYCNRRNVSVSVFDSDNTYLTENKNNEIIYRAQETLYDPRMFLLIDPVARIPTKITLEKDENGEMVRVSQLSGTIIPKPYTNSLGKRFYNCFLHKTGTHDTFPSDAIAGSYVPSLKFPHEEIMEALNITKSYDWGENDIRHLVQLEKEMKEF